MIFEERVCRNQLSPQIPLAQCEIELTDQTIDLLNACPASGSQDDLNVNPHFSNIPMHIFWSLIY